MARFSEEEVATLQILIELEIQECNQHPGLLFYEEYLSHLRVLADKLQNYQNKHYPEDTYDAPST
jgi:hypothetical protein